MQIANCEIILNEFGSRVPKNNVTPAEVQMLIHMHGTNAGKFPIYGLKIVGEVKRTSTEEKQRLKGLYKPFSEDAKALTVERMWPGAVAKLPDKFNEVVDPEGRPCFTDTGEVKVEEALIELGGKKYTKAELAQIVQNQQAAVESVKPAPPSKK